MREINPYTSKEALSEWKNVPVDDVGYIDSEVLMRMEDTELTKLVGECEHARYNGWRNYRNLWRETLGLDSTHGKRIMDFGCGMGIEALQFARSGNWVIATDIVPANVVLTSRILKMYGYEHGRMTALLDKPYIIYAKGSEIYEKKIDIFYANGVLHHTPYATEILENILEILAPDGEIRLMLYSDKGFEWATGYRPTDFVSDVRNHPKYKQFVCKFDGVGHYADWYNRDRIQYRWGHLFTIEKLDYITMKENFFGQYLTVTLKPKK